MDIEREIDKAHSMYQVLVARVVCSYANQNAEVQKQMLDSYRSIVQQYDDRMDREVIEDEQRDLDEFLDDPRHGQAESLNNGIF